MEYLVMECHTSYAVVLDSRGRFKKVANLGYQVGQELSTVVEMTEPKQASPVARWTPMLTAAACLCIVFTGFWQMVLLSMGTVLIQINPQIRLNVNRMERVISAEAVNADGAKVLFDYHPFGKTVEQVTEELTDRAAAMGYLSDGGEVHLTVDSQNADWKAATEHRLEAVIVHEAQNITIIIEHRDEPRPDDHIDDNRDDEDDMDDGWDDDDFDDDRDDDDLDDDRDDDDIPVPDNTAGSDDDDDDEVHYAEPDDDDDDDRDDDAPDDDDDDSDDEDEDDDPDDDDDDD